MGQLWPKRLGQNSGWPITALKQSPELWSAKEKTQGELGVATASAVAGTLPSCVFSSQPGLAISGQATFFVQTILASDFGSPGTPYDTWSSINQAQAAISAFRTRA
jgi:hypothetical protein